MYYYRTYYTDGTYNVMKTSTPIRKPADVCMRCHCVEIISVFTYHLEQIKAFILFEIFKK